MTNHKSWGVGCVKAAVRLSTPSQHNLGVNKAVFDVYFIIILTSYKTRRVCGARSTAAFKRRRSCGGERACVPAKYRPDIICQTLCSRCSHLAICKIAILPIPATPPGTRQHNFYFQSDYLICSFFQIRSNGTLRFQEA